MNYFKSTFIGNLTLSSTSKATSLIGKFNVKKLEMPSMQENWNFDWLKETQGQIDLHVDDLVIDEINMQDANITLKMKDNVLTVNPNAMMAKGKFSGEFNIFPKDDVYVVKSRFNLQGASASEF